MPLGYISYQIMLNMQNDFALTKDSLAPLVLAILIREQWEKEPLYID